MKIFAQFISLIMLATAISSCTSARWTVKDKNAIDRSDFEILEEQQFLSESGEISPEDPVIRLDLFSRTKSRYTQRVLAERTIQDYRPKWGFMMMGVTGSALAFVTANTDAFTSNRSTTYTWTLNAVGALMAGSGFFNMEPVGDPRTTGEERFLRASGDVIRIDTVRVEEAINSTDAITISYNDEEIYREENRSITNGQLQIPLADKLNALELDGPSPDSVFIDVTFNDSLYSFQYPISSILEPYARVTAPLTSLRNAQDVSNEDNIVADLVEGSQVKIASTDNELWYRVLYGISEHYILKEDAKIVWRTTEFGDKAEVVTVPRLPFGEVDVESNIPILRNIQNNAVALIITNQDYSGRFEQRMYAHRDGRLIKTYLQTSLGYQEKNIYELQNLSDSETLNKTLSNMRLVANDSTEVTVYLSGYASVSDDKVDRQITLLGSNEDNNSLSAIELRNLMEQINTVTSGQALVLGDLDFGSISTTDIPVNLRQDVIENTVAPILKNKNAAVLMGNQIGQASKLYMSSSGNDQKHHIFPYYFAKAIQQRNTNISKIYQYLERNISYTSRKLHDRPQDPLLLGNTLLDLVAE